MAPRMAKHPAGSAPWVLDERLQAAEEVNQAAEEFAFSASNNMEWLNEHMAEIFSRNPLNMTEISKTPGKLRGRTPMTARKRNPFEERAPLTDVFASTPNAHASPSHNTQFYKQVSRFQVAEDKENAQMPSPPKLGSSLATLKANTDSGYHEMTDEETGTEEPQIQHLSPMKPSPVVIAPHNPPQRLQSPPKLLQITRIEQQQSRRSETVDSFVSAKESPVSRPSANDTSDFQGGPIEGAESSPVTLSKPQIAPARVLDGRSVTANSEKAPDVSEEDVDLATSLRHNIAPLEPPSPTQTVSDDLSEASSPDRPILRKKSSLTFATLPTRDTILPKKSMGARLSRTSYAESGRPIQAATRPAEPEQPLPRRRSSRKQSNIDEQATAMDGDVDQIIRARPETSEVSKEHNKTSTQRLHERITMLGKMNPHRPSKSVSATTAGSQNSTRDTILHGDKFAAPIASRDEDDEWIGPISTSKQESVAAAETQRPSMFLQHKGSSHIPEPEDAAFGVPPATESTSKSASFQQSKTAYPDLSAIAATSTTPAGSPIRNHTYTDNPLSASKAKLFDMFKSARSIFASSAGASAQAKVEALPSQPAQARLQDDSDNEDDEPPPVSHALETSISAPMEIDAADAEPKTRRSSVRVQQQREQQMERQNAKIEEQRQEIEVVDRQPQMPVKAAVEPKASEPKKAPLATSQMSKHGEIRRPGLKTAPETQTKGRPAPVSIRVASQRVGQGVPSTAVLGSSLHESLSQSSQQSKPPTLKTKGSNSSMKSGLTSTIGKSSSAASSRPKALEAAARKKEQDEREAQRKADQKREMEKRRAAKAEEERRTAQEQKDQRAAEQRALEAKQAAQRQAMEQRRAEALKKAEQPSRPQSSMAQYERPPSQAQTNASRNDFRPLSKTSAQQDNARPPVPHINPAKPPKRYFQPDDEDQQERTFGQKSTGPVQQAAHPAKRRRTSELEEPAEGSSRPTTAMAPPMRLSTMQKTAPPNKFTPGYISAASSSSQAGSSSAMLKSAMNGNFQAHHPKTPHDLSKYSSAKIPFGDTNNQHGPQTAQRLQAGIFKTPGTSHSKHAGAKSSPSFPEGDNISLPEIATDSEDEDSDDEGFVPPDWANSPALRELLSQQQLVDPMKVFGPIGPLHMEELFKGNKERIMKFRKRTSSANWSGPDGLTEEERRKDVEARAKLVRDGGWTFNPNL